MNLDERVGKPIKISNQEEKDKRRFVEMFNNWSKYINPNQIYKSLKLSWSENKIRKVLSIIRLIICFLMITEVGADLH